MFTIAKQSTTRLAAYGLCMMLVIFLFAGLLFGSAFLERQYEHTDKPIEISAQPVLFPVGVDPVTETITEQPNLTAFVTDTLAAKAPTEPRTPWRKKLERVLVQSGFYQQLASPRTRILVIWQGERREEVAENFASILGWDGPEKAAFLARIDELFATTDAEGVLYPDRYVVAVDSSPEMIAQMIHSRFVENIADRYPQTIEADLPLADTLVLASLLEREAYSFEHMRLISGVIWNRLFIDMALQIDATLQYARASGDTAVWWPVPVPSDKWIDSPFNTYQNKGLPPSPIASPGVAAVVAALNPYETDCLFYFHDNDGEIYCSATYEEHVAGLIDIFGQGR